ncbi:MAG: PP2C family protein-serine/threonine phosphatase, partial [Terrimicrobiaceae bacterium]|nr:PP2C family protein-serine/threonine phosphatase [Terrimicrobiaceae bacterium]
QVLNAIGKPAFEEEDLEAFVAYANLTATAIEKLRALERTRQQERVERDLAIAAEIQKELLADALPSHLPGAEFAAFSRPATIVGGDFYMVTRVPERGLFFAIGDVAGKGIAASLLMAQVLSSLEFVFWHAKDPAGTLAELNAHLGERIVRGMFVTALAGLLEPESGRLLLASAGHPAPLAVSGGAARPVPLDPGLPLGIRCGSQYQLSENRLARGEWLVTFTDGLTESRNGTTDFESQIASVAAGGGSPRDIVERLVAAEQAHRGAAEQRDDLTILVGGPSV